MNPRFTSTDTPKERDRVAILALPISTTRRGSCPSRPRRRQSVKITLEAANGDRATIEISTEEAYGLCRLALNPPNITAVITTFLKASFERAGKEQ